MGIFIFKLIFFKKKKKKKKKLKKKKIFLRFLAIYQKIQVELRGKLTKKNRVIVQHLIKIKLPDRFINIGSEKRQNQIGWAKILSLGLSQKNNNRKSTSCL